jgi:hypothetical protein
MRNSTSEESQVLAECVFRFAGAIVHYPSGFPLCDDWSEFINFGFDDGCLFVIV